MRRFAQLMGGDQTSALYRVLVEQKKLATDAGANYDGYARDAGEFSVYAVPRPGREPGDAGEGGGPGAECQHHRPAAATPISTAPRPSWSPASPIAATASLRWRPPMARRLPSG